MRITRLAPGFLLIVLLGVASAFGGLPVAGASNGSIGIYDVAVCRDTTTVAAVGSAAYATNRVGADIYFQNAKGEEVLLQQIYTDAFGPGPVSVALTLPYADAGIAPGTLLRVEVRLQRLSGSTFVDVSVASRHAWAPDKNCFGACSVTVDTADGAPADGVITLRSHYGTWFRPEGWLHGAMPVRAGRSARLTFVSVPCDWTVRAWYYPQTGDTTPQMLPAQYWPNEFQANILDGTNPYVTSFASGLLATDPLEADDPFVVR